MELRPVENSISETVLTGTHPCGLRVNLIPKPGFAKTFGVFATNFGSIDNRFVDPRSGSRVAVPDGVAHFLEHKMFEDENGDVSDRFSGLGANCNASTGFTTTSYIFSATQNAMACVDLLLDFVQSPHFTPELVQKEQGIIAQEIRMYEDDPSWRIFFNLLEALYRQHPVQINIAGTVETISRIDPDVLFTCHRAFYRPGNMALTIVGGIVPETVLDLIESDLADRDLPEGARHQREALDDGGIDHASAYLEMDVARPKLLVGFKDGSVQGRDRDLARRELLSHIVLDLFLGRSSPVHEAMYSEGLIDDSFTADYTGDTGFGFVAMGGDTDQPELLEERLLSEVRQFVARGIKAEDFARVRNKFQGKFVGLFDSLESTAYSFSSGTFRDVTPFHILEMVQKLHMSDLEQRIRELFVEDMQARSIIMPRGADGDSGS